MSKTVLVQVGDRVRKEDSGLEALVTKIAVKRKNTLRSDVSLLSSKSDVWIVSGSTRKDGKASLQGFELVKKPAPVEPPPPAPFVDEPVVEEVKDLEKLPEAPMREERPLPGFTGHLERVTRAWAKTVAATVRKGTVTKGEMLDILFALTAGVGLECGFSPGELGDNMALVAGELVKVKAADDERRAS